MKEKKEEEKKVDEKEEKKKEEEVPQEVVLRVDMHCGACARKVARSLKGFQGPFSIFNNFILYIQLYTLPKYEYQQLIRCHNSK